MGKIRSQVDFRNSQGDPPQSVAGAYWIAVKDNASMHQALSMQTGDKVFATYIASPENPNPTQMTDKTIK